MNKTININLGGYPFTIDEDAYEAANHYLNTLASHFALSEGSDEIMQDIETRMGELINRNKGTRAIVNKVDILEAISVLGTPEELKNIDFSENFNRSKRKSTTSSFQLKTGKRLFRDPDDKILGGVCSGLASYFGIQDTVWVRIAFVLLAIAGGASFLIYIVLWAIVPTAKTVSDRLEMMGEPTNVNNIARMVKEELENFSDNFQNKFGKKNRHHKYRSQQPKDDDKGQILSSGWTWNYKDCRHDKRKGPFNKKDFV